MAVHAHSTFEKVKAHVTREQAKGLGMDQLWMGNTMVDMIAQQTLQKTLPSKAEISEHQI